MASFAVCCVRLMYLVALFAFAFVAGKGVDAPAVLVALVRTIRALVAVLNSQV